MKRLLSIFLAGVLAVTLAVPALAADGGNDPLWKQLGYESLEQCVDEEYYGNEDAYESDAAWTAWKADYIAAHPEEINAFLANADTYFETEYWAGRYYTVEEFMETYGYATHDEFAQDMLDEWLYDLYCQQALQRQHDSEKLALGGVPGEYSVMLNGTYITFPDAKPEAVGGRIMVPFRALLEAMGGTVSYDENGAVSCVLNGAVLSFSIGSDTVTVEKDGESSRITMDCTCYAKNSRTYVPVRFITQAAGYDVYWDDDLETAVLIDADAVIGEIDRNFTIVNRILASQACDPDQTYKTAADAQLDLTLQDGINGDQTYSFTANMDMLQNADAVNLSGTADLSDILDLAEYYSPGSLSSMTPSEKQELADALSKVDYSMILDLVGNSSYLKLSLMALLSNGEYGADDWIKFTGTDVSQYRAMTTSSPTVGSMLYWSQRAIHDADPSGSAYFYQEVTGMDGAAGLSAVMGDGKWVKSGSSYALNFDLEDYDALMTELYGEDADGMAETFDALDLSVTLTSSNTVTYSFVLQPHVEYSLYSAFKLSGSGSLSPSAQTFTMSLQTTMLTVDLRISAGRAVTTEEPVSAPPEGSSVVES